MNWKRTWKILAAHAMNNNELPMNFRSAKCQTQGINLNNTPRHMQPDYTEHMRTGICNPQNIMECNYACLSKIPASAPKSSYINPHTMDMLWEKFQWILPLYMEPISFQSKASVVCSVTAAVFIDFCLKKLNVYSKHIGKKNEYLSSTERISGNWNADQLSRLITS